MLDSAVLTLQAASLQYPQAHDLGRTVSWPVSAAIHGRFVEKRRIYPVNPSVEQGTTCQGLLTGGGCMPVLSVKRARV